MASKHLVLAVSDTQARMTELPLSSVVSPFSAFGPLPSTSAQAGTKQARSASTIRNWPSGLTSVATRPRPGTTSPRKPTIS